MKTFYRILSAAAFSAMFMACSIDEPYTNENGQSALIRVAEFPAYGADTKAVGTADEGKHSWDRNDVILLAIGDQKTGISYIGSGIWEFTAAVNLSGSAEVTAYYAPDYEWSGDALALKEGASAGLDEFLTYTYDDTDLSDGIDIVFSGDRSYSRLRVASVPGASVSLSGAFIPVNAETAIGQTAVSTVTDANGNAFFYGTWEDKANLKFSVGSSDFDKILSASVGNKSYVLRAGGYSYDEETATYHIADAEGLAAFAAAIAENPDVKAELYDDITLASGEGIAAWTTIASDYAGTFNGRGFSIKGLDAPFAASVSGTVQNVKFIGVNIAADGTENCGAVTKYLTGSILNTAVTGTVTTSANGSGDPGLGGLVGQADGKALIDNCYSNIDIWTQTGFITGGIVGVIKDSDGINILNCTAEGDIQRTEDQVPNNVGGILGRKTRDGNTSDNYIKGCLVTSTIQVTGAQNVGGIMGSVQSSRGVKIENCSVDGNIRGGRMVGGICGVGDQVTNCHVSGIVRSTHSSDERVAAGIVGVTQQDISYCVVEGAQIRGIDENTNKVSGIATFRGGTAAISNCAVINTEISSGGHAVFGPNIDSGTVTGSNNKYWNITYLDMTENNAYVPAGNAQDGEAFAAAPAQADFETMGYDFTTVWKWNTRNGAPELQKVGCSDDVVVEEETAA